jgi:hypothetical protein
MEKIVSGSVELHSLTEEEMDESLEILMQDAAI